MRPIDSALRALFRRQKRRRQSSRLIIEPLPGQGDDMAGSPRLDLQQWRADVFLNTDHLKAELDVLKSELARERAMFAILVAELQTAEAELTLEKANRSAAVFLLKKYGVVDGAAYASYSREQRVELLAAAMDEVVGKDTTSRWRARSPASRKS
jgi:hypothetical protein